MDTWKTCSYQLGMDSLDEDVTASPDIRPATGS